MDRGWCSRASGGDDCYRDRVGVNGRIRSWRARVSRRDGTTAAGKWALVVVAETGGPAVAACRQRFDPGAAAGMPPHITVLYPFFAYDETVREALAEVLVDHPPFRYELAALGRFPHVVYLQPEPCQPFVRLTEVTAACLGISPYEGRFDRVVPHLTVAMRRRLPRTVRRSLVATLPIAGEAKRVDVFAELDGRWTLMDSLALGGQPSPHD